MRKKTKAQRFAEGDTRQRGVKKLAAALAAEPKVEDGLPEVSPRLHGDGQVAYAFYRAQLIQSRMAAQVDIFALERACASLALIWRADRALQREGAVTRTPIMSGRGKSRKRIGWHQSRNKWFGIRLDSEKVFRSFANQFGIAGPTTRNGMKSEHSPSHNAKLWELLTQPRTPRPKLPEQIAYEAQMAKDAEAKKEPPKEPEPVQ